MSVAELPSERCPRCDSRRSPLEWARDLVGQLSTVWKCADCGATWSQVGQQQGLDLGDTTPALDLT